MNIPSREEAGVVSPNFSSSALEISSSRPVEGISAGSFERGLGNLNLNPSMRGTALLLGTREEASEPTTEGAADASPRGAVGCICSSASSLSLAGTVNLRVFRLCGGRK